MQWSLVAVILIVNALFSASFASAENGNGEISKTFEAFGYSPACVASALTSCEFSSTKELSVDVVDSIEATKSLLQEMKSEISNSVSEMKSIRQEIKSAVREEMQSVKENSVKVLLQEIRSDIKVILQEVKRELENGTDNSQSRDHAIPGGETTTTPEGEKLPKNCAELKEQGETSSGAQTVYPYFPNPKPVVVFCDQVTDGGGWTVIQSRSPLPIRENFYKNWTKYVVGFGELKGEFWLGLDNIHALTNSAQMELRIDLEDGEGQRRWAHYATFHVGDAASKYVLRIGGYTGNAGDGMTYPSIPDYNLNGIPFSTRDNDNDLYSYTNCAERHKGGWWFNRCGAAHLNGLPFVGKAPNLEGITWHPFRELSHSMKKANMKIRPVSLGF